MYVRPIFLTLPPSISQLQLINNNNNNINNNNNNNNNIAEEETNMGCREITGSTTESERTFGKKNSVQATA
jgi:hypothetical protein